MTQIVREQRIETTLPKTIVLYGQWYGHRNAYSFGGKTYNYILTRETQPKYLSRFNTGLANIDYIQSANITATSKTEVITDTDFIMSDVLLSPLIIQGTLKAEAYLSIRGDSIYTTYLDSVRITVLKKTSAGTETQIVQEEYPRTEDQPLRSQLYDYFIPRIKVNLIKDVPETIIAVGETIVLRFEVFGHSENAAASHNAIGLLFSRGSSFMEVILPVIQDS